jgi:hypothetical protein
MIRKKVLQPTFHTTQRDLQGKSDWVVFDYVWKENLQHSDIEAIVGFTPSNNGYVVEVGKLTRLGLKIDIDNRQSITVPPTTAWGQVGSGFVTFNIQ